MGPVGTRSDRSPALLFALGQCETALRANRVRCWTRSGSTTAIESTGAGGHGLGYSASRIPVKVSIPTAGKLCQTARRRGAWWSVLPVALGYRGQHTVVRPPRIIDGTLYSG